MRPFTPTGVKTWRFLGVGLAVMVGLCAQAPEPVLPRPGAISVASLLGEATLLAGEQQRPLKADERVRVGATVVTARKTLLTLTLSNGASVQLGSETEVEFEEFGQAPVSGTIKFNELKEEPSISRTRLRLVRGDVMIELKPLKVSRGSSFVLATPAGAVRSGEGAFSVGTRMTDLGLGLFAVELMKGKAEFERTGAAYAPLAVGRKLTLALEVDKITGALKVEDMPTGPAPKK